MMMIYLIMLESADVVSTTCAFEISTTTIFSLSLSLTLAWDNGFVYFLQVSLFFMQKVFLTFGLKCFSFPPEVNRADLFTLS
jgi:hypothetical protein